MTLVHRSADAPVAVGGEIAVVAAGVLPWRIRGGALEVLLIHRERYDDWSWPKGKLDDGETVPECAVREVYEEIGLPIVLGIPLPAIRYPVASGDKVVYYWAAAADGHVPVPDGKEVDAARWVGPRQAREMLTNPSDAEPLDALEAAHRDGALATVPFVVVRHAKAKPRSSWTQAEGKRPLAATGRRQAGAVANLLEAWRPRKVASSPWTRCLQTVAPYVNRRNGRVKLVDAITEHESKRRPKKARRAFEKLLDKRVPTAVCTHRPVLPNALEVLASRAGRKLAAHLPQEDPYLRPGAVIVAHQLPGRGGRIVSIEVFEAFED
ncbi:NUDIX hydrolase [Zafaria sp. Z1313]|uniref:NUDIX hydrolase n=1 Tax=unclassified Zafaria TaxID=2828765 RepID=UPI002E7A438B|nr:NUDIX hydrolase [Zafaria sp. J156]MEE1620600.1 NUDIX hydrolase [Zafaria sp. J156]